MRNLQFYNSLTRQKERFSPIHENEVGLYVCGMTVYDYCHVGHARVMVVFDVIARHLRELGYRLNFTRNITDIDDKIIQRARENGESIEALTARFIQAMHEDEAALGCLSPDHEPRATQAVVQMIAMIETLIAKNHAYVGKNGDVYFAIESFADYGKLGNQNLAQLRAGERVEVSGEKRDALDFVLWKSAKEGEPSWDSPWGAGRPGWHIECSVMAQMNLGARFDIHGGGMDLKFPHHECEIAQSEASLGHQHVNYWIHNGFVQIDNEKMSKSLGNFFTVREVLKQFDGEVLRYFILASHYRGPLNYSDAGLQEAKRALTRLYTALQEAPAQEGALLEAEVDLFMLAMNDDFNTPKALAVLFDLARRLNKADDKTRVDLAHTLKTLAARLGLLTRPPEQFLQARQAEKGMESSEIEALIAKRAQAKKDKDFAQADAIRAQLAAQGVVIEDGASGTTWRYQ